MDVLLSILLDQCCRQKYEFRITGCEYNCLSQIAYIHQFIYLFNISVAQVLYKYTLSRSVSDAVK